jgi:hypothetical protein
MSIAQNLLGQQHDPVITPVRVLYSSSQLRGCFFRRSVRGDRGSCKSTRFAGSVTTAGVDAVDGHVYQVRRHYPKKAT